MGTNPGAHLELLGWWSKSTGGSVAATMDKRLRMTCTQHRPEERGRSRTCSKVHTIVTGTAQVRELQLEVWSRHRRRSLGGRLMAITR